MRHAIAAIFASAMMLAGSQLHAMELDLSLRDGRVVSGDFELREGGLYLATEIGGSLHRWAAIEPDSLPPEVRENVRTRLLNRLELAQLTYESERSEAAARLFAQVYAHRHFLTDADMQRYAYANIQQKMAGLIQQNGEWITLAELKASQGLYRYGDQWLTRDQIAEQRTYRNAIALARGEDPTAAIVALTAAKEAYPDSSYAPLADQLIEQLVIRAAQPPATPDTQVAANDRPARDDARPRYVPERRRVRDYDDLYDRDRYDDRRYYYSRPGSYYGGGLYYGSYSTVPYYYYRPYRRHHGGGHHGHRGHRGHRHNSGLSFTIRF